MGYIKAKADRDESKYGFLTQWAAKVHLTLVTDNTAILNLGATSIDPLRTAGTSFSLGAGIGSTTQAVRTQDIDFFISFPEIAAEFKMKGRGDVDIYCKRNDGILLESDLDLGSAIDQALEPVRDGVLSQGTHPPTGASAPSIPSSELKNIKSTLAQLKDINITPPPPVGFAVNFNSLKLQFPELTQKLDNFTQTLDQEKKSQQEKNDIISSISSNISNAHRIEQRTQDLINNVVTPIYNLSGASSDSQCKRDIQLERGSAIAWAANVSLLKMNVVDTTDEIFSNQQIAKEKQFLNNVTAVAKKIVQYMIGCRVVNAKPQPTLYDPLDIISETYNFYITTSGSITPTWKLVHFSAPLNSPLASLSRKDTSTLIIAMGRPTTAGGVASPSEAMNQQVLSSILSQSLSQRP